MRLIPIRRLTALAVLLIAGCSPAPMPDALTVAAASSLANILAELISARPHDGDVRLRLGGTDFLARQIAAGADADVFIAADEAWMTYLADRGCVGDVRPLCGNRLVLVTRAGAPFSLEAGDGRLAIAEPDTVPAGRYAKQVLESLGVWQRLLPRMVWAGDVRMALAFVERGAADAAIVYATDAKASRTVQVARTFDAALHEPIVYPIAAVAARPKQADAIGLIEYFQSDAARPVFERHGFEVPPR